MLPTKIKIGGRIFTVKEKTTLKQGGNEFLGLCFLDSQEIHMRKKFVEEPTKAKTFLHEIVHGINSHFNLYQDDHDKEEEITVVIANGLNMVFVDNPELVEYLHKVYCPVH